MKGLKKIRQIRISFLKKLLNVILKKELGFLGVKPIPPLRLLFARGESYRGANPECNRLKSLQQRLTGGGRGGDYMLLLILIKNLVGIAAQLLYLCIPYFFIMGGLLLKRRPYFLQ